MLSSKKPSLLVLKYYHINDIPETANSPGNYVNCENFCEQLSRLIKWGYCPISMKEFTNFLYEDANIPEKSFLVTFEDGYQDIFTKAQHFLKLYSIPAHIFLISDFLGENWNKEGQITSDKDKILSLTEILKLGNTGMFSFGCHTKNHKILTELSDEDLYDEILSSKFKLEKLLATEIDSFSYPFGVFDSRIKDIVKKAGYKTAFITKKTKITRNSDLFELPRINMSNKDKALSFWYKVFKSEIKSRVL